MPNNTPVRFIRIIFVRFKEGTESSLLTFPRASYIRDEWPYSLVAPMRCDGWNQTREPSTGATGVYHIKAGRWHSLAHILALIYRCIIRSRAMHYGKKNYVCQRNSSRATFWFLLISFWFLFNSHRYKLKQNSRQIWRIILIIKIWFDILSVIW